MNDIKEINNTGNFDGGYFVLNQNKIEIPWIQKKDFFVTLPSEQSIKEAIIDLIRNAETSIKICSFIITDKDIYEEIEKVLEKYNVAVFLLTQLDDSKFSSSLLSEEEMTENYHQNHLDIIKKLYEKGAHVRATKTTHAKFIVSDRTSAFLMSANLTSPSLTHNPESGIFISEIESIKHLDRLFDLIFQYGTEYTKFITANSNKQFIISRDSQITKELLSFNESTNLRFTYETINNSLYQEIVSIIENSTSDIFISTYSIVGLEFLPEFISAITKKIEEGKSITIFSRGMNYRSDHVESCIELSKLGCVIYGDLFNHSKGIFTQNKSMIFTANIDGIHGLKNGFEIGAVLNHEQSKNIESFIQWQIQTSPYKFVLSPSKIECFNQYDFYCKEKEMKPLLLPSNIRLNIGNGNENLFKDIDLKTCYLKIRNKELTQIQIGKLNYYANFSDNTLYIKERVTKPEYNLESYLFTYESIKLITV